MAEDETHDLAPEDVGGSAPVAHTKGRQSLSRVRRELSDDELSSPAVQRLLIDDIERLEKEAAKLSSYQDLYYVSERKASVLEEKLKRSKSEDFIFGICLTIGSALFGLGPSLSNPESRTDETVIALGILLVIGGIASKVVKR